MVVPGEGPEDAAVMFIGEAPGRNEDLQGKPFVGQAGQFLSQLLSLAKLSRQEVYITNIVKCRPPANRDPLPAEVSACRAWLDRQIEIIRPKMVVTLGRHSMALFFPGEKIGKIHGQPQQKDGVIYFPMYHPAAALHQYGLRKTIEEDFQKIPELLKETDVAPQAAEEEKPPEQLSML